MTAAPRRTRRGSINGLVVVLLPLLFVIRGPSALAAPTPPVSTLSRYMQHVDVQRHYDLGCALGTDRKNRAGTQTDVVILHYFQPYRFSDGSYGAWLQGHPKKTSQIATAVSEFAHGYYICTGSDTTSTLRVVMGTTNYGSYVTSDHAKSWALGVNLANKYITDKGWSSQTVAWGGNDMELSWNKGSTTRAWVDGYDSICCPLLLNYGDAAGCRSDGKPAGSECGGGSYASYWTAGDVWYISWGASPAFPEPQIYRNDAVQAKQWYDIDLYAVNSQGGRMTFQGSLTQYQACKDVGCGSTVDNTPNTGWTQLWNALNCKYFTVASCSTAQSLTYSTDITWTD